MSGIVGLLNLSGEPVDRALLNVMIRCIDFRGPDARGSWTAGPVGFGHTLLATTEESEQARQPRTMGGDVWITADARIDGRTELIRRLRSAGRQVETNAPDVDLILHSYQVWGQDCLENLLGDFSFAIWDAHLRRLFCARDPLGVKPFYYAAAGETFVFSNTLDCVRRHPAVSDRLNELAIVDFLMIGYNAEPGTTTFAGIQRIPPAHCLLAGPEDGVRVRRYWDFPVPEVIRYRRPGEYVDHFRALFQAAVGDRLRTNRVAVAMSGGLDSPGIAATATQLQARRGAPIDLRAYSVFYDKLLPDPDPAFAQLSADALGIPIEYLRADDYLLFDRWDDPLLRRPEPVHEPILAVSVDLRRAAAVHSRVMLHGDDADSLFTPPSFGSMLRMSPPEQLISGLARYGWGQLRRPARLARVSRKMRKRTAAKPAWFAEAWGYPGWLNSDFEREVNARERYRAVRRSLTGDHPTRPEIVGRFTHPLWQPHLESFDPGVTRMAIETRFPFLDVRLFAFVLAVPPLGWFHGKELLRAALRNALPKAVVRRPKTPLVDFAKVRFAQPQTRRRALQLNSGVIERYVDLPKLTLTWNDPDLNILWIATHPRSLNDWLRQRHLGG